MQNTIYISGPITDPHTGQPREGWQEDFDAVPDAVGAGTHADGDCRNGRLHDGQRGLFGHSLYSIPTKILRT